MFLLSDWLNIDDVTGNLISASPWGILRGLETFSQSIYRGSPLSKVCIEIAYNIYACNLLKSIYFDLKIQIETKENLPIENNLV